MPLALLFAIVITAEVSREICFKFAALRSAKASVAENNIGYTLNVLRNYFIWLGFTLWGVEIVTWVRILQRCPLTIALPILSLCYVLLPITSKIFFHEPIPPKKLLAIACITLGVGLIGLAG